MTRKAGMLAVVIFLFLYTAWDFYTGAVQYDPLASSTFRKPGTQTLGISVPQYKPSWGKVIYEKNLFSPTRDYAAPKPYVPPPPPPPPPPVKPLMDLTGIVLEPYGDYVAYISIDRAKAVPMRKGDKIGDVKLVDLNERSVVVQWNGENFTLSLNRIKTIANPKQDKNDY
jgi:hypothetical protein